MSTYREMRLFVIFDLPTITKEDKKIYTKFRNDIMNDGFVMIQFSVYSRYCRNDTEYLKYLRRIKSYAPKEQGEIRIFKVTEKQYENMFVFSNRRKPDEKLLSSSPLVIIE